MSLKKFINSLKIVDCTDDFLNPQSDDLGFTKTKGPGWEMKAWRLCCLPNSIKKMDLGDDAESAYTTDICTCSAIILDTQWLSQFVSPNELPQYLDNMFTGVCEDPSSVMMRSISAILSQFCMTIFDKNYYVNTSTGKLSKFSGKVCFPVCMDANSLAANLVNISLKFFADKKTTYVQGGDLKDAAFSYIFRFLAARFGVVYVADWFIDASATGWWLDQMEFVKANTDLSIAAVKKSFKGNETIRVSKESPDDNITVIWSDPTVTDAPRKASDKIEPIHFLDESVADEEKLKKQTSILRRHSFYIVGELSSGICYKLAIPWRMDSPTDCPEGCLMVNIEHSFETDMIYERTKKAVLDISAAKEDYILRS